MQRRGKIKKMKFNFKKISAVATSILMTGLTLGAASAASFPAPFVEDGKADVAIVHGANANLDLAAAGNIQAALASHVEGEVTIEGGDSYQFEKTSTKFHLGDTITGVISSDLDEDQMPVLLNDGTYIDDDNDEFDFTQKISMEASQLVMFDDNDYKVDEPSIGFKFSSGADVLTYTLEFSEEPLIEDLPTTDLSIMGKDYYVLEATSTKLTLLDSASSTLVSEGESQSVTIGTKTYVVSIEFIDSDSAKLNVNGEITNDISTSETYKLSDGSYLGLKEILYSAKDTGISKVEFSIGNGKLVLENGQEINMNEDAIDGMTSTITNSTLGTKLTSVAIDWNADDEIFVTEDSVATMPGFEAVSLAFGGLDYPAEETIEVSYDGDDSAVLKNFPLKDSVEDINLLYTDGTSFTLLGKDSDEKLVTGSTSVTFDTDTDSYFVASWTDGRDTESYLMRATNFKVDSGVNKTTFQHRKDGAWADAKVDRKQSDTFSLGNAEFTVGAIDKLGKSVVLSNNSVETNFNTLYSEEGLKVILPSDTPADDGYINFTANPTSWNLTMVEEDKDGDVAQGDTIKALIGLNSQTPKEVTVSSITGGESTESEIDDTDVFRDFVYSDLATEILFDKGGDQDSVKLMYHGEEVAADVMITSADAVVTDAGALGEILVKDTEIDSVKSKNLVIVGGSCINSAAATLLGGAHCGEAFTTATGVGAGEFLIKGFEDGFSAGKLALLVAGYEAEDTSNAATYLARKDVDTMKSYKGTSATEATMLVE
jgi:hypothetical protein